MTGVGINGGPSYTTHVPQSEYLYDEQNTDDICVYSIIELTRFVEAFNGLEGFNSFVTLYNESPSEDERDTEITDELNCRIETAMSKIKTYKVDWINGQQVMLEVIKDE